MTTSPKVASGRTRFLRYIYKRHNAIEQLSLIQAIPATTIACTAPNLNTLLMLRLQKL
jgi:hypothetical protein